MFLTSEHVLAAEIAYRHERIAADWTAANGARTSRPVRRPRRSFLRLLPAHREGSVTPA